jgi:hypothetical protein
MIFFTCIDYLNEMRMARDGLVCSVDVGSKDMLKRRRTKWILDIYHIL